MYVVVNTDLEIPFIWNLRYIHFMLLNHCPQLAAYVCDYIFNLVEILTKTYYVYNS